MAMIEIYITGHAHYRVFEWRFSYIRYSLFIALHVLAYVLMISISVFLSF
jgi:hypothetical protein